MTPSDFQPLNPVLYGLLQRHFGEDSIEVVAAGEAIDWHVVKDNVTGRYYREVDASGEEYRMRCPLCHDHRPRLYINHRWGVVDKATKTRNLWLVQCFNTNCLSDYEAQREFCDLVYSTPRIRGGNVPIREGRASNSDVVGEIAPPGPMWQLDVLAKRHPNHPAVEYLEQRHFDVERLGRLWHVSYCPTSRYYLATNRIIIPIYSNGQMVGWQARYIGDDVNGVAFNKAGVPKYWTSPGFKRRRVAYNFDRAVQHSTVIIVEGTADVWSAGVQAMAVLGKSMSPYLQMQLTRAVASRPEAVIAIMLDPDQDPKDKERRKPHHIEKLANSLRRHSDIAPRVIEVYLPEGCDPGSTDRSFQRELIRKAAAEYGLKVSFARP